MLIMVLLKRKMTGGRQNFILFVDGGLRLVHISGHIWDILLHVKSLVTASNKSAVNWFIRGPTIDPACDGSVRFIDRSSPPSMIVR